MVGYGVTAVGIGVCNNAFELSIAFELISKRLNIIDDGISISWIATVLARVCLVLPAQKNAHLSLFDH